MKEVLQEQSFKQAFTGDDIAAPDLDVLSTLAQQAGEDWSRMEFGIEEYERLTGPSIRAAVFVRDSAYAALLSGLSTQRVLQDSALAGELARASKTLGERYKDDIDALRSCQ
jgi:hypothetical protein